MKGRSADIRTASRTRRHLQQGHGEPRHDREPGRPGHLAEDPTERRRQQQERRQCRRVHEQRIAEWHDEPRRHEARAHRVEVPGGRQSERARAEREVHGVRDVVMGRVRTVDHQAARRAGSPLESDGGERENARPLGRRHPRALDARAAPQRECCHEMTGRRDRRHRTRRPRSRVPTRAAPSRRRRAPPASRRRRPREQGGTRRRASQRRPRDREHDVSQGHRHPRRDPPPRPRLARWPDLERLDGRHALPVIGKPVPNGEESHSTTSRPPTRAQSTRHRP